MTDRKAPHRQRRPRLGLAAGLGVIAAAVATSTANATLWWHDADWLRIEGRPFQRLRPTPSLLAEDHTQFGAALAADDQVLLVGATGEPSQDSGRDYSGVVHVYERRIWGWTRRGSLRPSVPQDFASFGGTLALGEGFIAAACRSSNVGTRFDSSSAPPRVVDVFERDTLARLGTVRLDHLAEREFDGATLAAEGRYLVATEICARSASHHDTVVHLFEVAPDGALAAGLSRIGLIEDESLGDRFGWSLAIDRGRLFVGAPYAVSPDRPTVGAVRCYDLTRTPVEEIATIWPPIDSGASNFGAGIAAENGVLVVGAPDWDGGEGLGFVVHDPLADEPSFTTYKPYGEKSWPFGESVATNGATHAFGDHWGRAGEPTDNADYSYGVAYLADSEGLRILGQGRGHSHEFGHAVALTNSDAIVGSPGAGFFTISLMSAGGYGEVYVYPVSD